MQNNEEFWAIVELMGHQKVAGRLSEYVFGGTSFLRIDVPSTETNPSFTRMLTDKAIYAINPVTEEIARFQAERMQVRPIEAYDFRTMITKQLELEGKVIVPAAGNVVTVESIRESYGDGPCGEEWQAEEEPNFDYPFS